jgi:hypothetical protein
MDTDSVGARLCEPQHIRKQIKSSHQVFDMVANAAGHRPAFRKVFYLCPSVFIRGKNF